MTVALCLVGVVLLVLSFMVWVGVFVGNPEAGDPEFIPPHKFGIMLERCTKVLLLGMSGFGLWLIGYSVGLWS